MVEAETICANLLGSGRTALRGIPPLMLMSSPEPKRLPSTIVRDDEDALVSLARKGDLKAFDELVNRYETRIFRLAMNITQNREDAEDATQDAFMKSFQHLPDFQGGSRFYTWLVRIAVNEALMRSCGAGVPMSPRSMSPSKPTKTSCPAKSRIGVRRRRSVTKSPS